KRLLSPSGALNDLSSLMEQLPNGARKIFEAFAESANKSVLHPFDWQRFYAFIRHCHAKRIGLTESDIGVFAARYGFQDEIVSELESAYFHGRGVLAAPLPKPGSP
ncbi:MAG: hypothetical protein ACR2L6_11860, partial [Gemmatimonadaceae bacterium]